MAASMLQKRYTTIMALRKRFCRRARGSSTISTIANRAILSQFCWKISAEALYSTPSNKYSCQLLRERKPLSTSWEHLLRMVPTAASITPRESTPGRYGSHCSCCKNESARPTLTA